MLKRLEKYKLEDLIPFNIPLYFSSIIHLLVINSAYLTVSETLTPMQFEDMSVGQTGIIKSGILRSLLTHPLSTEPKVLRASGTTRRLPGVQVRKAFLPAAQYFKTGYPCLEVLQDGVPTGHFYIPVGEVLITPSEIEIKPHQEP